MACVADAIDTIMRMAKCTGSKPSGPESGQAAVRLTYAVFAVAWLAVWELVSAKDFSAIVTLSSLVQCFAFVILSVKVHVTKCVAGLSSRTLQMFVLFYAFRLTSTWLNGGYNPVDPTGDYVYQAIDTASLGLVLYLLYGLHKTHVLSYQEEHDTLPLLPLVVPCCVLAFFVHGSFSGCQFFDIVWATSTNLETFTMLPQLWMMGKMGGTVDGMTSHFVAATLLSTVLTFTWWWHISPELEKRGPCLIAKVVTVFQMLKLLLSGDFMYYYCMSWLGGTSLVLPARQNVDC